MEIRRRFIVLTTTCLIMAVFSIAHIPRQRLLSGHGLGNSQRSRLVRGSATHNLTDDTVTAYLDAIMDLKATNLSKLECPALQTSRYQYLQASAEAVSDDVEIEYFFALDLRQALPLLPQLLGSVLEAIRFLGPTHCALSIVEGSSPDGTGVVLSALRERLDALGTTYTVRSTDIDTKEGDRIGKLAALRNMALQPLIDAPTEYHPNATVIFLNDVAPCTEDMLELIHQRHALGADMTCAMDWTYVGPEPTFYDVWVSRGLTGNSFFEIPLNGSWDRAWDLFWDDETARSRLRGYRPFQVFSCWNGAVAFGAAPLLEAGIAFRSARPGDCFAGEPQLFCTDLWARGYGKIAVVPSVNLEYSVERGRQIKILKGYTSQWTATDAGDATVDRIEWQLAPPEQVKCIATWGNQFFEAWNASVV